MSEKKLQATARVEVTIEVYLSLWSAEETVKHIAEVSAREAVEHVGKMIIGNGNKDRIIGKPKVTVVMTREEGETI